MSTRKAVAGYEFVELTGKGSFGKVWKGQHIFTKELAAIKVVPRSAGVVQEKELLEKLKDENIAKLLHYEEDDLFCYLVLEYAPGGSLLTLLEKLKRPLSEIEAKIVVCQLLKALLHCAQSGVAHRDIKLENILISGDQIKLVDFGLAQKVRSRITAFGGSPDYSAPEVVMGVPFDPLLADVWSLGVLLYVLLHTKLPFVFKGSKVSYHWPAVRLDLSTDCLSFLSSIWEIDPRQRATLHELASHPWITSVCHLDPFKELMKKREAFLKKLQKANT